MYLLVERTFKLLPKSIKEETIRWKRKKNNKSIDTESRKVAEQGWGSLSGDGDYNDLKCVRKAFHM